MSALCRTRKWRRYGPRHAESRRANPSRVATLQSHPVAAIQDVQLRLRDDVVSEPNQREANQASAPAVEDGLFLVPKVIE